jgi:intracellular multiplication protein IcmT
MWRHSANPVYFFVLDCRCLLGMVLWLVDPHFWTFFTAIFVTLVFGFLAWMGLTLPVALRMARVLVIGPHRPRLPRWKQRDYA